MLLDSRLVGAVAVSMTVVIEHHTDKAKRRPTVGKAGRASPVSLFLCHTAPYRTWLRRCVAMCVAYMA